MQQKMLMYQLLERHLGSLRQQAALIENRFMELQNTKQLIEDLQKPGDGELLIPLGSGFFMEGKITDRKNTLANVGAGIIAPRDAKTSLEVLEAAGKEIEKVAEGARNEMERVSGQLNQITMEIEAFGRAHQHEK